jgi:hypothetical protein
MSWTKNFPDRQMELAADFSQYLFDHPELDSTLPEESYILFEVAGQDLFNRYCRNLASQEQRQSGARIVRVRVRPLKNGQRFRVIDSVSEVPSTRRSPTGTIKKRARKSVPLSRKRS